jgi:hypothetical protein
MRRSAIRSASSQSKWDGDDPNHAKRQERGSDPMPVQEREVGADAKKARDDSGIERNKPRQAS